MNSKHWHWLWMFWWGEAMDALKKRKAAYEDVCRENMRFCDTRATEMAKMEAERGR